MRVSKTDGSQANDLQRDALIAADVDAAHLYEDRASDKREDRPGLTACLVHYCTIIMVQFRRDILPRWAGVFR